MKAKRLFPLLLSCLSISGMTASAKSEHFSDDFVSFDYDTDPQQYISITSIENRYVYTFRVQTYNEDPEACVCYLSIISKEDCDENKLYGSYFNMEGCSNPQTISEDPLVISYISKDNSGTEYYGCRKLLGENDFSYAIATYSCPLDFNDEYLLSVFDSISLNENYYTDFSFSDDISSDVYINVTLSEQMYKYINKAVEISNEYLDLTLSQEEASKQIEQLIDRCEKYSESSEFYHDTTACHYVRSLSIDIKYGDDYDLMKDIEALKVFYTIE